MIIELGNRAPRELIDGEYKSLSGPCVTSFSISPQVGDDGALRPGYKVGTDVVETLRHFAQNPGPVKHLGGNELLQEVIDGFGRESTSAPTWVAVTDGTPYPDDVSADLERFLSEYWSCERGKPADVEDTHYTQYGLHVYAPGEAPATEE